MRREMQRDRFLAPKAVANELGVTTQTVYNLIHEGTLIAYKIGQQYRVRRSDLDTYLERTCTKHNNTP